MASHSESSELTWRRTSTRIEREYRLFSVRINENRSPITGRIHEFQVLESPDWVAVIAVTPDDHIVLVNQYRHGIEDLSLEPPGGLIKENSTPEQSAKEELEEETGYVSSDWSPLGWMYPVPAVFTNKFYVFLAKDATPTGNLNPDETEAIETLLVPATEIREHITSGKIRCSVQIAALHLYLALRHDL